MSQMTGVKFKIHKGDAYYILGPDNAVAFDEIETLEEAIAIQACCEWLVSQVPTGYTEWLSKDTHDVICWANVVMVMEVLFPHIVKKYGIES
jgi:hypothetical protein